MPAKPRSFDIDESDQADRRQRDNSWPHLPSREARQRVGFLAEQPYFYDYLTVPELLDLAGRLFGVDHATRKKRADFLIDRVGLGRARHQSSKSFPKA